MVICSSMVTKNLVISEMRFVCCQCGVEYSLSMLESTLTTPNGFVLRSSVSFFNSDVNRLAHLVQQETNLDMYAV